MIKSIKNLVLKSLKIWKLYRLILALFLYLKQSLNLFKIPSGDKIAYFNRKDWVFFQRYTYILAKYFLNEGYQVYFPKDLKQIYHFSTELDCKFLLKEKKIFFGNLPKGIVPTVEFCEKNISPKYFKNNHSQKNDKNELPIPIGFHPFHYYMNYLPSKVDIEKKRINKVFFAGNFKIESYSQPILAQIFKIQNRSELFSFLKERNLVTIPQKPEDLQLILEGRDIDTKDIVIVLGKSACTIHPSMIKEVVRKFQFFLAFPGMYMPLCHNLTEAMSVGTIPILEENYAKVISPPLNHLKNCITFSGSGNLEKALDLSLKLSEEEKKKIRGNVLEYFEMHLSSKAIVKKIESGRYRKYLLMAEQKSVELAMRSQLQKA